MNALGHLKWLLRSSGLSPRSPPTRSYQVIPSSACPKIRGSRFTSKLPFKTCEKTQTRNQEGWFLFPQFLQPTPVISKVSKALACPCLETSLAPGLRKRNHIRTNICNACTFLSFSTSTLNGLNLPAQKTPLYLGVATVYPREPLRSNCLCQPNTAADQSILWKCWLLITNTMCLYMVIPC